MWGLALLQQGKLWRFVVAIAVAGLFHKSAVALILIALASRTKNKFITAVAILGIGAGLYVLLLADAVEALMVGYLQAEYQSAGAGVRVAVTRAGGNLTVTSDPSPVPAGWVLQLGVDVQVDDNWYINADVKHLWLGTDVRVNDGAARAEVDMDPWIVGLGIGYKF